MFSSNKGKLNIQTSRRLTQILHDIDTKRMLPKNLAGLVRGSHKARARPSDNTMSCGPLSLQPQPPTL